MAYQGDLKGIGLATVLQNLTQGAKTGNLSVACAERERHVYFREGRIRMVSAGAGRETPLGDHLVRTGAISSGDIARAMRRAEGRPLLEALRSWGGVRDEDVARAAKSSAEEEIYDLFTWTEGRFVFEEGEPPQGVYDEVMRTAGLSLAPEDIILEAARRVDEWERINRVVGGQADIYVVPHERRPALQELKDPRLAGLAALIDGRRDVAKIIHDSSLGRYAVLRGLSRLIQDKLVRPASPEELASLARRAEEEQNISEAVRLVRRALELERKNVDLRRRLASLLESEGDIEGAAGEMKLLAALLADADRVEEAEAAYREAARLRPGDLSAREKLVEMLSEKRRGVPATTAVLELADTYAALGLHERSRAPLEMVLRIKPKDAARIEMRLLETCRATGDIRGAVDILRRMARRRLNADDFEAAARLYEDLLALDSRDGEARRRLAEIQAGIVERMREYRRSLVRAGVLAAVGLPVLVFVMREMWSSPAEAEARVLALRSGMNAARAQGEADALAGRKMPLEAAQALEAAAGGFLDAAECMAEFGSAWRGTRAAGRAAEEARAWLVRAGGAYLAAAVQYERATRWKKAQAIYARLSRSTEMPAEIAAQASRLRALLEEGGAQASPVPRPPR